MEEVSLAIGVVLMLVAAIGIVGYVALVIAIPVCRLIDWLAGVDPQAVAARQPDRSRAATAPRHGGLLPARLAQTVASPLVALRTRLHRPPAHHADGASVCPACHRPLEALE